MNQLLSRLHDGVAQMPITRCLRAAPATTKIRALPSQLIQGNAFMLRRSLALFVVSIATAAVLFSTGCSGPDAPVKKGGGSGKSLTTAAP